MAVAKTNVASSCQLSQEGCKTQIEVAETRLKEAWIGLWKLGELPDLTLKCIQIWINHQKYSSCFTQLSWWEREREKKNCAFQQLSGVSKLAAHPPSGSTSREQVLDKNNKLTHKVYTETWYIDTVQKVSVQMSACNYEPSKAEEYRNMATFLRPFMDTHTVPVCTWCTRLWAN